MDAQHAPRKGDRGTYAAAPGVLVGFEVLRVEGNLCFAKYDGEAGCFGPFIWRHPDGLNTLHDWPGKPCAALARASSPSA